MPIYRLSTPGQILGHLSTLYRDTRNTQQNLYPASFAKATEAKRRQKVRHPPAGGTQPPHIAGPLVARDRTNEGTNTLKIESIKHSANETDNYHFNLLNKYF